ncbi:uncharacterized protein LOC108831784 [Raphanus sativus]|uniref:Uncharacterized protein LOC108831784 n=1 Tax=Raphanus sativus TaxID=3726 RepID=A0A9W3C3I4_RAPSA|nr:uncharacterized protein LOC108831784 [Raphanus sativus]
MGKLVRLWRGEWLKEENGAWNFHADPTDFGFGAMIRDDESYESLLNVARMRYVVGQGTLVVLSYQFPSWILGPLGRRSVPISITTTADIPVMLSVREWFTKLVLVVTIGAESVARYHYNRRDNFVVGRKRYVVDGTQDEYARREFQRLVVGRRKTCSRSVLEDIFNEHEMMVLHRVDLEMDLADRLQEEADRRYEAIAREVILVEDDDDENMADAQTGGENDPVAITDPTQLPLTQPSTDPAEPQANIGALPLTQLAPALPKITQTEGRIFRRSTMETAMDFWEGLMGEDLVLPDGVEPDRAVVEGEGREEETIRLVDDGLVGAAQKEDDSSSTGSCVGLVVEVTPPVSVPHGTICFLHLCYNDCKVIQTKINTASGLHAASNRGSSSQVPAPVVASGSGISVGQKSQDQTTVVVTTELGLTIDCGGVADPGPQDVATKKPNSSSDESGDDGYVGSGDKDLFVGKTFENRDAFKHHMALYAIKNKFVYRCAKSSPSVMVLECVGLTCTWRVYAVLVKGSNMYEVRKIGGEHCCSVDERAGYQRQATSSVIGGLLRQQFSGTGAGPRPGDIRQVMRGDHAVNISYWKAWRSRELAVDIAKGSCGASYKSLPNYLQRLVEANPGTITQLHTEYVEELGYRFKYMFVALGACVKGFQYMRKVVVVDGTHLRGKYAGCLLTASAQDGNYQIFPLAFAIVDGENDKSWEWFFHKLSSFVPDNDSVVFVSD